MHEVVREGGGRVAVNMANCILNRHLTLSLSHTERPNYTQATVAGTRRVWLQRNEGAKVGQPEAPAAVHPIPTAKRADTDTSLVQDAGPAETHTTTSSGSGARRPDRHT